jgi:hypothetical protein
MRVLSGTVVQGKIEVPADSFADGAHVMILAAEPDEPIRLTPEEEDELSEAIEQIRQGNYVDGQTLLDELRSHLKP